MLDLSQAFASALWQIVTLNPQLLQIIALSLKVTLTAVAIATLLGFAVGGVLAVYRFPGRGAVAALLNALMGLPPVVAGLIVYLLLSNAGPLGVLQLLYTPGAMIIAQVILITPIVAALTRQTCEDLLEEYRDQLRSKSPCCSVGRRPPISPTHLGCAALRIANGIHVRSKPWSLPSWSATLLHRQGCFPVANSSGSALPAPSTSIRRCSYSMSRPPASIPLRRSPSSGCSLAPSAAASKSWS
jgi:hypothetical protein